MRRPEVHRIYRIERSIKEGKYPNAAQLAKMLEVSQRTVQRDIEYMRDLLGAPVEYDKSKRGYYY